MTLDPAKRVAINTGLLYLRMGFTVLISLYTTRLVLNTLGAEDFGIFNVVGGAIAMLTFLNNAMTGASQRFMSYAEGEGNIDKQKSIFNVSMILHFLISLLVVLLLEFVGFFLFNGILNIPDGRMYAAKVIYQYLIISTFFTIISVPYDAVINAHENMFLVAVLGILEAILKLAIAFYITHINSDKLIQYGLLMAALSILLLIIRQVYCQHKYLEVKIKIKKYYNKKLMIEMTKFAGWSFLGSSISLISNSGQAIVSNMFFGTKINAAQGIAGQVNGQISVFSTTMLKALNPAIIKSEGAGNRNGMIRMSILGSKLSFYLLALFAIPIFIELPNIMNIWLVNVPEYAIVFCRLLIIKTLIEQIVASLPTIISAMGDIKNYQIYMSIVALLPLPIAYLMFKQGYSPPTIFILYILQALVCSFIIIPYFIKKHTSLNMKFISKEVFLPSLIVFFISFTISYLTSYYINSLITRLIVVSIINIASIIISTFVFGFNIDEKRVLMNVFSSVANKFRFYFLKIN